MCVVIGSYLLREDFISQGIMAQQKKPVTKWSTPDPRFSDLEGVKSLATSGTKFSLASYKHLGSGNQENMFFSPASISTALAMVFVGAEGKTSEEMAECLQISEHGDKVHELFRDFFDTMQNGNHDDTGYTLKVANRLFASKDYSFLQEFGAKCNKFYRAEATSLDFKGNADGSKNTINEWVEGQTETKIKNLIPDGMIGDLTVMILVNAIYFKGDWMMPFSKDKTETAKFYASTGEVDVEMMKMTSRDIRSGINKELDCTYVDLPYGNKEMSMTIIVPNKRDGLQGLEEQLTHEKYEQMMKQIYTRFEVNLYLPRFKMEYEQQLNQMLKGLGMNRAFTSDADFSGMDGTKNLSISAVVHKAFVEVNEEGTEAAAATAMGMAITSMPAQLDVKCDHPFLFLIRERASGSIIFMGRLMNPAA